MLRHVFGVALRKREPLCILGPRNGEKRKRKTLGRQNVYYELLMQLPQII